MPSASPQQLAEAFLSWWRLAGVNAAVTERAHGWLAGPVDHSETEPDGPRSIRKPTPVPVPVPVPLPAALAAASKAQAPPSADHHAQAAVDGIDASRPSGWLPEKLADYADALRVQDARLPGRDGRTARAVPQGQLDARVLVVVEGPEPDALADGAWLSAASDALLSGMLRATGIDRSMICLTGWGLSAPGTARLLGDDAVAAHDALLARHITLARPALVLAAGRRAAQSLFGTQAASSGLLSFNRDGAKTEVALLPALDVMTRRPADKARCWATLRSARALVPRQE